jgi:hypothetical protein
MLDKQERIHQHQQLLMAAEVVQVMPHLVAALLTFELAPLWQIV